MALFCVVTAAHLLLKEPNQPAIKQERPVVPTEILFAQALELLGRQGS